MIILGLFLATVNAPAAVTDPLPSQNQCMDDQEYQDGLCYTPCRSGFTGAGPVCWQKCPSGYTDKGLFCDQAPITKSVYGRGAGEIKSACVNGKVLDGGLCYTPCPSGWKGVGPACRKGIQSKNRGSGSAPSRCEAGMEADPHGALCYPVCKTGYSGVGPMCWQDCPAGYADNGAFCSKTIIKAHYGRGVGSEATAFCQGQGRKFDTDYTKQLSQYTDTKNFTMIVASDPRIPGWMDGGDPQCNYEA